MIVMPSCQALGSSNMVARSPSRATPQRALSQEKVCATRPCATLA